VTVTTYAPTGVLLVAGAGGIAELWDPQDGVRARLDAGGPVAAASFGDGGRLVLTLAANGAIRVWRTDGRLVRRIDVHGKALPKGGSLDPDGRLIATVGQDRFARLYSVKSGRLIRLLPQQALVHCALFSPDGSRIVTCGHEGVIRVWSRQGRLLRRLTWPVHGQAINAAAFSPNGNLVAAAIHDGSARIWDVRKGERIASVQSHFSATTTVAFNPAGDAILTASGDSRARTWEITSRLLANFVGHSGAINAATFSPDGRWVLTAGEDGTARIWDASTDPRLSVFAKQAQITAFALSDDGTRVVTASGRVARVRSVGRARVLRSIDASTPITAVAFGPRGPVVGTLPTLSVAVSKDGTLTARGREDGSVLIERAGSGDRRVLHLGRTPITAVAFSPDAKHLATGSRTGGVGIWDVDSAESVQRFAGHTLEVTSVSFSPDGKTLLTSSADREARTWDAGTGRLRQVLGQHFGTVADASFSPDGRWVVTAGCCGGSVIQAFTGERSLILRGHTKPLVGAAFGGADGRLVVTAAKDGTIRSYHCEICGDVPDLIALAKSRLKGR
jgi:WD40 repeat protein